jgi:hypothetical protein
MSGLRVCVALNLFLSLFAATAHSAAIYEIVDVYDPTVPCCFRDKIEAFSAIPLEVSRVITTTNGGLAFVDAFAYGNYTAQKTRAVANLIDAGVVGVNAGASTRIADRITFHSDTVPDGIMGVATYKIDLEWDISVDNQTFYLCCNANNRAAAYAKLTSNVGGIQAEYKESFISNIFGNVFTAEKNGLEKAGSVLTIKVPVTFGIPTGLLNTVEVFAEAIGGLPKHASVVADHSVYWGGISSVTVGGIGVNDFWVTSESGTDYLLSYIPVLDSQPVPEPQGLVLILTGLGLIGWLRLHQRVIGFSLPKR